MKFSTTKTVIFARVNGKLKFVRSHGVMGFVDCPSNATDYSGKGQSDIVNVCAFFGLKQDKEGRYPYTEIEVEYTVDDALLAQLEESGDE